MSAPPFVPGSHDAATLAVLARYYASTHHAVAAPAPPPTLTPLEGYLVRQPVPSAGHAASAGSGSLQVCQLCNVTCNGSSALAAHMNGRAHRRRVGQRNQVIVVDSDSADSNGEKECGVAEGRQDTRASDAGESQAQNTFYCSLCDVSLSGWVPYTDHMNGARHRKAVARADTPFPSQSATSLCVEPGRNVSASRGGGASCPMPEMMSVASVDEEPAASIKHESFPSGGSQPETKFETVHLEPQEELVEVIFDFTGEMPEDLDSAPGKAELVHYETDASFAEYPQLDCVTTQEVADDLPMMPTVTEAVSGPSSVRPVARSSRGHLTASNRGDVLAHVSKNAKGSHVCGTCGVVCNSGAALAVHKSSRKHKRKLERAAAAATTISVAGPEGTVVVPYGKYMCTVCMVKCDTPAALESHKSSPKHMRKLEQAAAAAAMPVADSQESEVVLSEKHYCSTCSVNCNTAAMFAAHLASQKHIRKTQQATAAAANNDLTCTVCNIRMTCLTAYKQHLAGAKHHKMLVRKGMR